MTTRPLYLIGEFRPRQGLSEAGGSGGGRASGGRTGGGGAGGEEQAAGLPSGPEGPIRISEEAIPAFPEPSRDAGWILIAEDVQPRLIVDLLGRLARSFDPWSPLLVRRSPTGLEPGGKATDGVELIPLSPGWPVAPDEARERIEEGGSAAGYLSFRLAMEDLSRVRHDINNPLTAALAEVQLSLLDVEPGSEFETSLRVVEDQIRRIRDLVKSLTRYRTPRP